MYIEPNLGLIEKSRSVMAATNASHRTGLRAADNLDKRHRKTWAVEASTLDMSFD